MELKYFAYKSSSNIQSLSFIGALKVWIDPIFRWSEKDARGKYSNIKANSVILLIWKQPFLWIEMSFSSDFDEYFHLIELLVIFFKHLDYRISIVRAYTK